MASPYSKQIEPELLDDLWLRYQLGESLMELAVSLPDEYQTPTMGGTKNKIQRLFSKLEYPLRTNSESKACNKYAFYTRDVLIGYGIKWVKEHGRLPRKDDWHVAPPGYPSAQPVTRIFGKYRLFHEAILLTLVWRSEERI